MDNSKEFIIKCEKAVEIQKQWKPQSGDWFSAEHTTWVVGNALIDEKMGPIPVEILKEPCGWGCKEKLIWLPRLDQLQEIICKDWGLQTICAYIESFSKSLYGSSVTITGTMEQLWLAYIMYELYQKKWDDDKEDWYEIPLR